MNEIKKAAREIISASISSDEAFERLLALSDERQKEGLKLIASIRGKSSVIDFLRQINANTNTNQQ